MENNNTKDKEAGLSGAMVGVAVGVAALALLSMMAVFVYAPYYSFRQIRIAAEEGNETRFEEFVDIAAIRASLVEEIKAGIASELGQEKARPEILDLFSREMVKPMLEEAINATLIMRLLSGSTPQPGVRRVAHVGEVMSGAGNEPTIEQRYEGLNRFVVRATKPNSSAEVVFVLVRNGLGWQLDEVRLPTLSRELQQQSLSSRSQSETQQNAGVQ